MDGFGQREGEGAGAGGGAGQGAAADDFRWGGVWKYGAEVDGAKIFGEGAKVGAAADEFYGFDFCGFGTGREQDEKIGFGFLVEQLTSVEGAGLQETRPGAIDEFIDFGIFAEQQGEAGARFRVGVGRGDGFGVETDGVLFLAVLFVNSGEVIARFTLLIEPPRSANEVLGEIEIAFFEVHPPQRVPVDADVCDLI